MQPFIGSTNRLPGGAALSARMRRDGYLVLRGVLPAGTVHAPTVHAPQGQTGPTARHTGRLRRDAPAKDATADPAGFRVDPDPTCLTTLGRIDRLEGRHALSHHPALPGLFERMLDSPVVPFPRVLESAT